MIDFAKMANPTRIPQQFHMQSVCGNFLELLEGGLQLNFGLAIT